MINLYQHEGTGNLTYDIVRPNHRWFQIPTIHEDELPDDMTPVEYDRWYENSYVDFVRVGPKI